VRLSVELFESELAEPDLADPYQAISLGRQELATWDTGTAVYEARASVVQTLPDQDRRAAATGTAVEAVMVPADYQTAWRLRLELHPVLGGDGWSAGARLQLILPGRRVVQDRPLELPPATDGTWRLELGPSATSGGYLFAVVRVRDADIPPAGASDTP